MVATGGYFDPGIAEDDVKRGAGDVSGDEGASPGDEHRSDGGRRRDGGVMAGRSRVRAPVARA